MATLMIRYEVEFSLRRFESENFLALITFSIIFVSSYVNFLSKSGMPYFSRYQLCSYFIEGGWL